MFFIYLFFFCGVIFLFSSRWKRWNQFYHYNISGCGEILYYKGLRQMSLISLQWDLKSGTCQRILDYEFHCGVPLSLYGVLQMSANTNLNPGTRILITWVTWHIRLRIGIFYLSISGIEVCSRCYISHCFYLSVFLFFLWFFVFVCWLIFGFCWCLHVSRQ